MKFGIGNNSECPFENTEYFSKCCMYEYHKQSGSECSYKFECAAIKQYLIPDTKVDHPETLHVGI